MSEESAWQRAGLPLALLATVSRTPMHGYAVARALEECGYGRVSGATLYPALVRLTERGHLAATWSAGVGGPGRKVFRITDAGTAELDRLRTLWRGFVVAMEVVDEPSSTAKGRPVTVEAREVGE